jgi:hypothetical protein
LEREDDLNFLENGRQSKYLYSNPNPSILGFCTAQVMGFSISSQLSTFSQMEKMDLKRVNELGNLVHFKNSC